MDCARARTLRDVRRDSRSSARTEPSPRANAASAGRALSVRLPIRKRFVVENVVVERPGGHGAGHHGRHRCSDRCGLGVHGRVAGLVEAAIAFDAGSCARAHHPNFGRVPEGPRWHGTRVCGRVGRGAGPWCCRSHPSYRSDARSLSPSREGWGEPPSPPTSATADIARKNGWNLKRMPSSERSPSLARAQRKPRSRRYALRGQSGVSNSEHQPEGHDRKESAQLDLSGSLGVGRSCICLCRQERIRPTGTPLTSWMVGARPGA